MNIRPEQPSDVKAIFDLTKVAFANHRYGDHTEQFITDALRAANALIISLVAELDGKIVGHVAFSPVSISDGSRDWVGLGPVCVSPEYQKQGIGTAIIREGILRLRSLGAKGCVLLGDPAYYVRFGFVNHPALVLDGFPPEYLLCLFLEESHAQGTVSFHKAFLATG